ncbi:MAG: indolepyruvate oxidoreductase subunit beta [Desulfobulbaceae bacterium A2]|nr:MAG: indolepyruvate oxidoreductase subunit beta [Desulfobulbaceae bacterium A2]
MKTGNILFSGVGGQGILLASEVTALAFLAAGQDVKKSEVHGMAQRGGSVVAHLRYGERVYSPLIEPGAVDVQLAFELLEAARYLPMLGPRSTVVLNRQRLLPPSVALGQAVYPEELEEMLRQRGLTVVGLDALEIARETGEVRTVNLVMVGALSVFLPLEAAIYEQVIEERVPRRFREVNRRAFALGRQAVPAVA